MANSAREWYDVRKETGLEQMRRRTGRRQLRTTFEQSVFISARHDENRQINRFRLTESVTTFLSLKFEI